VQACDLDVLRRLVLLVMFLGLAGGVASAARPAGEGRFTLRGTVSYVVDGDTLQVALDNGRGERVRLIGVDTPERGRCFAATATRTARALADDRRVLLKGDATQATRDRYGRLLAYVWINGARDLGFQLLARGVAKVYVYDRPFQRLGAYRRAESIGRRLSSSVWRGCNAPPPPPTRRGCDPSYPTVCIPPPPPDLDCDDVPYSNFTVRGNDPHGFDGDGDGVGCED
jgi:micrococcal nuclease